MPFTGVMFINIINYKLLNLGSIDDCKAVCTADSTCAVILNDLINIGTCIIFKNDALNYLYTGQKIVNGVNYDSKYVDTYIKQSY